MVLNEDRMDLKNTGLVSLILNTPSRKASGELKQCEDILFSVTHWTKAKR